MWFLFLLAEKESAWAEGLIPRARWGPSYEVCGHLLYETAYHVCRWLIVKCVSQQLTISAHVVNPVGPNIQFPSLGQWDIECGSSIPSSEHLWPQGPPLLLHVTASLMKRGPAALSLPVFSSLHFLSVHQKFTGKAELFLLPQCRAKRLWS